MTLLMFVVWVIEVVSRATPAASTSTTVEELETVNLMARVKVVPAETTILSVLTVLKPGKEAETE
jgi:hypothetical protein